MASQPITNAVTHTMTTEFPISHPDVASFFDPATNTITHIVSDPETKAAAIIDSVLDYVKSHPARNFTVLTIGQEPLAG